jgi:long-subunit acyl-CoA synthetase (AMP-forming)
MPTHLLKWYQKLGIIIQEVYAMTENHGGATLMPFKDIQSGSVGIPLANSEVKIEAETGEVCTKAPWQMTGYYNEPEKTAEVIKDGWIHTGDQGEITKDGHLRLTGRVKDTFKTTKGEYIVPGPIEFKFVKSNFIEQICIVGLGVPQPMAMVNLSEIAAEFDKEEIEVEFNELLKTANAELQGYEKVKKIIVMKEAWSVENGILTPTLKIKRNQLDKKYKAAYHDWFAESANVLWK